MIIRMMYVIPMILGRTFDLKKNTVGVDIFSMEDIENPRVIEESFYRSNYKTVESSSDVKDILEINGDLSLNIKAGTLAVSGFGSYVKSAAQSQNSVDILIKVSFRTVSKSLTHSARPVADWSSIHTDYLGTHYVQSILYGGDLIACIRFKAVNVEDLQDIRATVKASVSSGSALDLVGEGKLEILDKKLEKKATMEINYFATVPVEGVPNTIAGLRELVRQFENHVKKVNGGLGVPVEVELRELSTFDRKFEYIKNLALETELEFFEEYLDDLLSTKAHLKALIYELPHGISKEDEKRLSKLNERISTILRKFFNTIADLDLSKGSSQLDSAKEAYKEGKGLGMAGKFRRELNKILKKVDSNWESEDKYSSAYTQYGSSECTKDKNTVIIFSGYVASSPRNEIGSGYNYICMPKSPPTNIFEDSPTIKKGGSIAGVKYGLMTSAPINVGQDKKLSGVVCSVCLVKKQTVYTLFGQDECPGQGGWKLQYAGYLMIATDIERSEGVCVDSKLENQNVSYMGQYDQSLNFALTNQTGKMEFVSCVVCSK